MDKQTPGVSYEESNRLWYEAIGEFVVKFEHTCQAARTVIVADLNEDNTQLAATKTLSVLATLGAKHLAETITMLLTRTKRLEPVDKETLKRFESLIARRNTIVHSPWLIGWGNDPGGPVDPWNVTAFSPSRKTSASDAWEARKLSIQDVRDATAEAVAVTHGIHQILRHAPLLRQP